MAGQLSLEWGTLQCTDKKLSMCQTDSVSQSILYALETDVFSATVVRVGSEGRRCTYT